MTPETLESLLLDRAMGELAPETAELLAAYLAQNPSAAARASGYESTLEIARAATVAPQPKPRPFDAELFRRQQRALHIVTRRTEVLRLAACLTIGLGLGWLGKANYPALAPAQPPIAAITVAAPAAPPSSAEATHRFWSVARFAPELGARYPGKAL